ncbi:MAG: 4-hydroxy-tetrahydrodipicolinate synthase [Thiobacillaceae bacterium]|jgi:4-hydroxy-tetrahydrodipicolinate synthase|nr:4-hydroxy-tetrahydrodipicolinate synthase [Thiobacillaceae bacterium]
MIQGSLVAIVTPMFEDGSLDIEGLRSLVDWHIAEGSDGIVIVGTTGESPTVSFDEHCQLIRVAVEQSAGRIPVIAGTGANSTSEAIELTRCAKAAGAQAGLSVVPYYNKPTQEGLYRHYKAIAEAVELPLILYNVPGRTVADLTNDTALRLAQVPGIVGIKDATGSMERAADLLRRAPPDFALYSGDDGSAMPFMLLGGHGVISVTANVAPKLMHEMCVAARAGNLQAARQINNLLLPLHSKLFVEANPIPVKWACAELGLIKAGLRLPLTALSAAQHEVVRDAMRHAKLI